MSYDTIRFDIYDYSHHGGYVCYMVRNQVWQEMVGESIAIEPGCTGSY